MPDDIDHRVMNNQLALLEAEMSNAHAAYIDLKARGEWEAAGGAQEQLLTLQNRYDAIVQGATRYTPQQQVDIRALPRDQQDRIAQQYLTEKQMEAARVCGVPPSVYLEGMAKQGEADVPKGQKI